MLAAAQFLVVLDTAVMNVSISQLVADFHTDVTTIQGVITVYTMVMAAFLLTGGTSATRSGVGGRSRSAWSSTASARC